MNELTPENNESSVDYREWYNARVQLCLEGSNEWFETKLQFVHEPQLGTDAKDHEGGGQALHPGIADVFIMNELPKEWNAKFPRSIELDVRDGSWWYVRNDGERVTMNVTKLTERRNNFGIPTQEGDTD